MDGRNTGAFAHCSQELANKRLKGRRLCLSSHLEGTGHGVSEDTVGGGDRQLPHSIHSHAAESAASLAFSLPSAPPSPHP